MGEKAGQPPASKRPPSSKGKGPGFGSTATELALGAGGGRHVFYVLCTLPVSAGESIVLLEEFNRSLGREVVGREEEHAIMAVTPSVVELDHDFERGWQLAGESRLLKVEASTLLATRTVRRWLLKGRFDKVVAKGGVHVRFVQWGLGTDLPSQVEKGTSAAPKRRAGLGMSRKQWALLDEADAEAKSAEAVTSIHQTGCRPSSGKDRAGFNKWFRDNASISRSPAALEASERRERREREIEAEEIRKDRAKYEEMVRRLCRFRSDSTGGRLMPGGLSEILHPVKGPHVERGRRDQWEEGGKLDDVKKTNVLGGGGVGLASLPGAAGGRAQHRGLKGEGEAVDEGDADDDVEALLGALGRERERMEQGAGGKTAKGGLDDVGSIWTAFVKGGA